MPHQSTLRMVHSRMGRVMINHAKAAPSKEWCIKMAELEGNSEIGAGSPDHPLRNPAPAKAAPMREDMTPVTDADRKALSDATEYYWQHSRVEDTSQASIDQIVTAHALACEGASAIIARHRLAHTARPDAGDEVERLDLARFGASERAGYLYPGEDQQKERAAFCEGAALAAMREGVDAARARAIKDAAAAVVNFRVGDLPGSGWLKDNGASRAALARLVAALKRPAAEGVDPDAATGCADDQAFAAVSDDALRETVERLSRQLDVSPDKIRDAIANLRAKGLIE